MRLFICLSIFSFMLATCQGDCFSDPLRPALKDGEVVKPSTCVDRYDGETHPIWSTWKTAHCFVCDCSRAGMTCCERASGLRIEVRCEKVENPESFEDDHRLDDECRTILPLS